MNETLDLIHRHRSIRSFGDASIPDEHIHAAIEAGQLASTSSNIQAYSLIRVTDPAEREALVELTGGQSKVAACGAFFAICGDSRRHRLLCDRAGTPYRSTFERFLTAIIDASLFAQNLALAFESMGYGICYIGGLRNKLDAITDLLKLPHGVYPLYGLCVGAPAETPPPRPRLPVDLVYFEGRYQSDDEVLGRLDAYDESIRAYYGKRGDSRPDWSAQMADLFAGARREDAGSYYRSQGANLD